LSFHRPCHRSPHHHHTQYLCKYLSLNIHSFINFLNSLVLGTKVQGSLCLPCVYLSILSITSSTCGMAIMVSWVCQQWLLWMKDDDNACWAGSERTQGWISFDPLIVAHVMRLFFDTASPCPSSPCLREQSLIEMMRGEVVSWMSKPRWSLGFEGCRWRNELWERGQISRLIIIFFCFFLGLLLFFVVGNLWEKVFLSFLPS
jgi:hypothetical protein